jgi:aryl carrier-like protein
MQAHQVAHKELNRICDQGWMNTTDVSGGEKCIKGMIIDTNTLQLLVVEEMNNRDFVPVADEVEAAVERLWRQNLGVGTALSASANFFRVGGDSLKAGQLISSIRKMSGVFLTVAELFSNPTIRGVSNIIKERAVTDSM